MVTQINSIGKRVDDFVYSGAIRLLGGGGKAYSALAERYIERGWFAEALETYKKAIDKKPSDANYHYRTAQLLYRLEQINESLFFSEEALRLNQNLAEAYVLLGCIHKRLGNKENALVNFGKAMAFPLKDADAYNVIAKAFAEAGNYEEAVKAYREIVRISPKNVTVYGVMADTYAKLNRYPEALEAYRHAVDLKPTADGYGILAAAYAYMGEYKMAVAAYQKAMKLEPGFAHGWGRLSEIYIKLEDFEKRSATAKLDDATKESYANLRKEQEALVKFKETIRLRPNDPEAYLLMGEMYMDLGFPAKAIEYQRHVLRMKTPNARMYLVMAKAHLALSDFSEARWAIEQSLKLSRTDVDSWKISGEILIRQGKHEEAARHLQEAVRLKPQDAALHRQMGDLLRRLTKYTDASRYYWQAIRLNPLDSHARYGLGISYVRLNQRDRALEQKAILKTIDAQLATDLEHIIWRLTKTPKK